MHFGLPTRHGLAKREQQRQIGVNATLFQLFGGLNSFPGRGDLDQHTVNMNAFGLIKLNETLAPRQGGISVKTQARVHFGRHPSWHRLKNFATKTHQQSVDYFVKRPPTKLVDGCLEQRRIAGLLHCLKDERRVGGCILRLELSQLQKVPRVRNHSGELSQGVELVHGRLEHAFMAVLVLKITIMPIELVTLLPKSCQIWSVNALPICARPHHVSP